MKNVKNTKVIISNKYTAMEFERSEITGGLEELGSWAAETFFKKVKVHLC